MFFPYLHYMYLLILSSAFSCSVPVQCSLLIKRPLDFLWLERMGEGGGSPLFPQLVLNAIVNNSHQIKYYCSVHLGKGLTTREVMGGRRGLEFLA